ncbi:MAG: tRNA pseudouridine(13) synthase TruD [Anaerolineae bacterium]|nr:tRNA pseudouridine(13) synthase TruD [Anaerolineae bacterium]
MDDLRQRLDWHVPYLTSDLPGIGGIIRNEPEDFIVDEVPAYEPCGEGEHTYFRVEKRAITTMQLVRQIAEALNLPLRAISYAGLKDARAVARQTLSVQFVPVETIKALVLQDARVLWVNRHRNKLRVGHLRGNRFTLRIRGVVPDAEPRAAAILGVLARRGVPNAYGPQRFGNRGDNAVVGYHLLRGDAGQNRDAVQNRDSGQNRGEVLRAMGIHHLSHSLRELFLSALQSALFNQVVAQRLRDNTVDTVILGDVARKEDTGGIFTVDDVDADRLRADVWEISATGPIYGYKMMGAQGPAGEIEERILADAGLGLDDFRVIKERGLRRPLRFNPTGLTWHIEGADQVLVSFFAPKGSFATAVLRELMKTDAVPVADLED